MGLMWFRTMSFKEVPSQQHQRHMLTASGTYGLQNPGGGSSDRTLTCCAGDSDVSPGLQQRQMSELTYFPAIRFYLQKWNITFLHPCIYLIKDAESVMNRLLQQRLFVCGSVPRGFLVTKPMTKSAKPLWGFHLKWNKCRRHWQNPL